MFLLTGSVPTMLIRVRFLISKMWVKVHSIIETTVTLKIRKIKRKLQINKI